MKAALLFAVLVAAAVPGLASGGWVWPDTVREFAGSHTLYVVTLPGLDGRPAVEGNPFDAAKGALGELIASRHLAGPVLVGHSLGATLAIALAGELPGMRAIGRTDMGKADELAHYRELMTGASRLKVAPIDNARHFAMIDQPRAVHDALRRFLKSL